MLWSSVKPFQSVAIPYRYRSGCRMMCPTGCLFPVSCVARCVLACRFLIRFVLPPRRACRASLRLSASYRRLTLSRLIRFVCLLVSYGVSTPRPVVLISRACPSHLIRSSCPLLLRLLASLCLFSPSLVSSGGAFCVSFSSRHASRLPSLRFACPLLGVLTVILNAVAMGTVGCGAFVPRFHKLHLLSMGVVCISSSARRPLFFYFLASPVPRVDNRGDVR